MRSRSVIVASILLVVALVITVPLQGAAAAPQCGYEVDARVSGGHGSVAPAHQYVSRKHSAAVNIYPDAGYQIGSIWDNGHSQTISNPYVIQSVKKDHDVVVTFARKSFTVTASVDGGHGQVSPATQSVLYQGTASIDITPDPGYNIATIADNGVSKPIADPYRIVGVAENHAVVVTFAQGTFTVDASVQGGNGTVAPPTQAVAGGGTAAVNITPDPGYVISTISDNSSEVPISNPYVITSVHEDHDVIVTFEIAEFTITASVGGGHGTVDPGSQTAAYGSTAAIDITPDSGYSIASITDNGSAAPIADPYLVTNVTANHNVVVTFALTQHSVDASVSGGNGTAVPPTQTVAHGGTASIDLQADPGFHLATITDNGVSKPLSDPYVINNVTASHTVVVTFADTNYMVAASVSSGHGTATPASQLIAAGAPATIHITADPGYHTASIIDNGTPQGIVVDYTIAAVNEDHAVVVTFAPDQFTVLASAQGPGGTVDPPSQAVVLGGTAAVNITTDPGYHIERIVDNGEFKPISDPYNITNVTSDHTVAVFFDNDEFDVNAAVAGGDGTVSPPAQVVAYGDQATIQITASPGWRIETLVDNGVPVAPADPYVIDNVTANHDVAVTFARNEYTVDASVSSGHGTVDPATQAVTGGGTAVIDIAPANGYHIATIADNGAHVTIANPYVIKGVATDHDVVVTFAVNEYTTKATVTGGNGAVNPVQQTVPYGDTTVINLLPDYDYHPAVIVDNGKRMPVSNPYFIDNTVANHDITVAFAYDQSPTFYLAEGSTAHGFSTYITIENPNAQALNAELTYMLDDGSTKKQTVGLPALSQVTVSPVDTLGARDFSTQVTCLQGKTIAVDRTMSWTGPGAPSPESHSSVGVTSPETTWYLPEGCSGFGFETWTLVENPNAQSTSVELTYMIEGVGPKQITRTVPAHSRATYSMEADIGPQNASIEVGSSLPVVAERSMYRNNRREGSDSIGTDVPSTSFYLAEGSTAWGFTTYVLVQNPETTPANVTLTCMTTDGPKALPPFQMAPQTRQTVNMNDLIPNTDFSTLVTSDKPIVAERAMYWGAGSALGEACHDSIGLDEPHATFYMPDGQTSNGRETYTLVANPNDTDVEIMVSYLFSDGTGAQYFLATIPANSRATFNMADKMVSGRAAIAVTCLTQGKKILAERSMYWNNRGAGTDTVGDWSH